MRLRSIVLALLLIAAPLAAEEPKGDWVKLFNGKDLTGWKIHPKANGAFAEIVTVEHDGKTTGFDAKLKDGKTVHLWRVEEGILIGSGPASHLLSEQDV